MNEIRSRLEGLATKEDVAKLAIRNETYVLGGLPLLKPLPWDALKYSFNRAEFVHPLIVRELCGWLSDRGSTVIAVDVAVSNRSNRFFGDYTVADNGGRPRPTWRGSDGQWFAYSHVATSPSGVQMVECYDSGGGTGIFGRVALLTFEGDLFLEQTADGKAVPRQRILLKILGNVWLGDRYIGDIEYRDGRLLIGPDRGAFARGAEACDSVSIE